MWRSRYVCLVIVSLLICLYVPVKAQQELPEHDADRGHDPHAETDTEVPWYSWDALFDSAFHKTQYPDTTLAGFHQYDFYQKGSELYSSKGNTGHAVRPLYFTPGRQGFHLHRHARYPYYLHTFEDIRFHRPEHVYSELFFVLGAEREQNFYAKHNQRLHEHMYGGFKYMTVNSPGRYGNMGARNSNFMLYAEAEPLARYHVAGSLIINRIFNTESGGLEDHNAFEEDEVQAFMILENAETRYRDIGFRIAQSYKPAMPRFLGGAGDEEQRATAGELRHTFTYKREAHVFEHASAPSSEFYADFDPDNTQITFDSTLVHHVINTLQWSNQQQNAEQASLIRYQLFLNHHLMNIRQPLLKSPNGEEKPDGEGNGDEYVFLRERYAQFKPGVRITSNPELAIFFEGVAQYSFGGYNDQDHKAGGSMLFGRPGSKVRMGLHACYAVQEAPYFMQQLRSNYVQWDLDLQKSRTLNAGLKLKHPAFSLEGNYYLMNRAVFMDAGGYPAQHDDSFPVFTATLKADLHVGFLKSQHQVIAQFVDETHYDQFPSLLSHHSIYSAFSLFDEALFANTGLDVRYNTPYKPMAYLPMVRHFAIQDVYETGHEILVDVFASVQISRARLFVKYEHVLGILTDRPPVYDIPFYPLPETMFKFGVSWMFFN